MLSSVSAIVDNREQAAYAAASTFLDDFARFRASNNLPGTSIDLDVVSEIGYVAEKPELQARLDAMMGGDANLTEQDVLALVKLAILGKIDESANHQCVSHSIITIPTVSALFGQAKPASRICGELRSVGTLTSLLMAAARA